MKHKIIESPIIFLSIVKWFILAICVGGIVGISTTLFLKTLDWAVTYTHRIPYYFWYLPLTLPISSLIIDYLAPEAEGYGARVIEAIHKYSGRIPPFVAPVKFVATLITIAFGGSAGKTGPCAQIGAGLTSIFASLVRLNDVDRKKLVTCGISAAFAVIFGTTLAGAIFGIEVLFIGALFYDVFFPSFISGLVAYQIALDLGLTYSSPQMLVIPDYNGLFLGKMVFSGVVFGLCALILIESLRLGEHICQVIPMWKPLKGVLGGLCLILLVYVFSEQYLGLGSDMIANCLHGTPISPGAFLIKILFVTITLNFCGSGGIITPILVIGATIGNLFGQITGHDLSFFTAIGMVSLLAGAANVPLTACIMAMELFGPAITPYAAIACITSFLMAGHRSVYPSQILYLTKSSAFGVDTQKELREIHTLHITPHPVSIIGTILKFIKKYKRKG